MINHSDQRRHVDIFPDYNRRIVIRLPHAIVYIGIVSSCRVEDLLIECALQSTMCQLADRHLAHRGEESEYQLINVSNVRC